MNSHKPALVMIGLTSVLLLALIGSSALAFEPPSANVDYQRLFAPKGKLVQPGETLRVLRNLAERLQQGVEAPLDDVWTLRLKEIKTLVEHNDIVGCRSQIGWRLSNSIDKYKHPKHEFPTIMAYLMQCRSSLFAKCNLYLDRRATETLAHFAKVQSSKQIENFRKFLAKHAYNLPQLTFAHNIPGALLEFMNDQLSEHLNPTMSKEDFDAKFSTTLKSMCTDIKAGSEFLAGFDLLFTSSTECKEMEEELRDLYRMKVVCSTIADDSAEISDFLHEYLVSKGNTHK